MIEVNFEAVRAKKITTGEEIPIPAIVGSDGYTLTKIFDAKDLGHAPNGGETIEVLAMTEYDEIFVCCVNAQHWNAGSGYSVFSSSYPVNYLLEENFGVYVWGYSGAYCRFNVVDNTHVLVAESSGGNTRTTICEIYGIKYGLGHADGGSSVTMSDNPNSGVDLTVEAETRTLAKDEDVSAIKADLIELTPIKSTTLPIATSENYSRFAIITQNDTDRLFINLKKNGSYEWFEFKQGDTPTEEAKFGFAIFGTSKFN